MIEKLDRSNDRALAFKLSGKLHDADYKEFVPQIDQAISTGRSKLRSFCEHYGTAILPAKPYMARHKGKIERGIGYVKGNSLKGRKFTALEEQNRHLQEWERTVADTRIHGTTRRHVGQVFEQIERPALRPLPRSTVMGSMRNALHAGTIPNSTATISAIAAVNPSTVGSMPMASSRGRFAGAIARSSRMPIQASATPAHAPSAVSRNASASI